MFQHERVGHGCGARFIHFMAKIVQQNVVLHQIFGDPVHGYLIAQPPADDRWVIVALSDQLPHLIQGVLPAVGHVFGDIGDLRPHDHAVLIAKIVELLCMLIMGKPYRVGSDLANQFHIERLLLQGDRIPNAQKILMPAHSAQRIGVTIQ